MKHICVAYFNKSSGNCIQTIEEHIKVGVNFLEEIYLKKGLDKYLVRLAGFLGLSICREQAQRAFYASYIFHDLGKLFLNYQKKQRSFRGHEVISAYWLCIHGEEFGLGELLYPVIYAVYLHHHDIRKREVPKMMDVILCDKCLKLLINTYREKTCINLMVYKNSEIKLEGDIYNRLNNKFNQFMNTNDKFNYFRLSYPLLQAIHGADNYSAASRGGKQTLFSVEIEKVYRSIKDLRERFKNIIK